MNKRLITMIGFVISSVAGWFIIGAFEPTPELQHEQSFGSVKSVYFIPGKDWLSPSYCKIYCTEGDIFLKNHLVNVRRGIPVSLQRFSNCKSKVVFGDGSSADVP